MNVISRLAVVLGPHRRAIAVLALLGVAACSEEPVAATGADGGFMVLRFKNGAWPFESQ